jgi:hypothetical protein
MTNIFASSQTLDRPRSRKSPRSRLKGVRDPGKKHELIGVMAIIHSNTLSRCNARNSTQGALPTHEDEPRLIDVPLE